MAMGFSTVAFTLCLLSALTTKSTAQPFKCTSNATCQSLIDYVTPNKTSLAHLKTFFGIKHVRFILEANNLPLSTPDNYTVEAENKIKIPIPCICFNGTGVSNKIPIYIVQKDDGLYHIAADVFAGLLTYPQIAAANNISDPNLIQVGQELWIPLPCSCEEVKGEKVVHYGYVVEDGDSMEEIAAEFGTDSATLFELNAIVNDSQLIVGNVLDVPLKACTSNISTTSLDYPLLVPNGTYVVTANDCVKCECDSANNWTLQCESSQLKPASNWETCPTLLCEGSSDLYLGNTTSSGCNSTSCVYTGYSNQNISTSLSTVSTCAASTPNNNNDNDASRIGLSWKLLFISVHLVLLYLHLLQ